MVRETDFGPVAKHRGQTLAVRYLSAPTEPNWLKTCRFNLQLELVQHSVEPRIAMQAVSSGRIAMKAYSRF